MPLAEIEIEGSIGTITLTHPEKRNALSAKLVEAVIGGFERMRREKVRAVVLRAPAGAKVWSAGHDVSELPEGRRSAGRARAGRRASRPRPGAARDRRRTGADIPGRG